MKSSIVVTVLNEEKTLARLLQSIVSQTKKPDEVIIVDGGSTDATASVISSAKLADQISNKQKIIFLKKLGNRAVGRNWGIRQAKNEIVAITDAGCVLDKNWVKNIITPFKNSKVDVVAGYYQGISQNIFQKSLVPYVLVMPDRVNPKTFLPASRSMALKRAIWKKTGGFPEKFSDNEDFVFAQKLKKLGAKIVFQKRAVVFWMPRKNLIEAFMMFFKFAKGDIQAQIIRPKVILVFLRYLTALILVILNIKWIGLVIIYLSLAVIKNYRYVKDWRAIFILPLLQLTADIAVLTGSIYGIYKRSN